MCLVDWSFAGFKLHFNVQKYHPDDPRFYPVYRGCVEQNRGVVMHIGTFPNPGKHLGAERLHAVLRQFPALKVSVAHLGLFQADDFWRIMDRYPSVYMDTAFILGNPLFPEGADQTAATLKRFPERVLYGSDFPLICHRLEDGLQEIAQMPWDTKTRQKLMLENAEKFLSDEG